MRTILLVEDDPGHVELMRRTLEEAGTTVHVAGSLLAAKAVIARMVPSLALVDHHLPDGSGDELFALVARKFPILLMTAHGDEHLAVDAIKAGALDYLVKSPEMFRDLPHIVERALREWGLELDRRQALHALHESEERYRRITEGLTDYLYSVEVREGQAVATSHGAACVIVTGYTSEEFAANPKLWLDMILPEDRARVVAHVEKVLRGEQLPPVEHRIRRKDGGIRWVSDKSILHFDAAGNLAGYDGVIRDNTERRQAEEARRQSEERYRTVVDVCPEAVFVHADGRIIFANHAAAKLMGAASLDQLIGLPVLALVDPACHAVVRQRIEQMATEGVPVPLLGQRWRRIDGAPVEVMVVATPINFSGRAATLVIAVNVTSQRQTETELRKLSRAVEQSPVAVVITDLTGAIEYVNPSFTATTGYTFEEVKGANARLLGAGHGSAEAEKELWATITAGREWRGEFQNRKKNGELFWEAAAISPIVDEQGRITHFLAVKEDITARKRTEVALAMSERRFRLLVENVPNIAVQGYDRQRRVIFWNEASAALYGYSAAEAQGRLLEDLIIPAEMREGVIAAVENFVRHDAQIPAGELVLRRKDGAPVSVYSSHVKLDRADGEPEMYCIDIDLAARKEAERALAASHEFHLRILNNVPAMLWRIGTDARCDWFSERWLAFTGRTMEEQLGDGWMELVHPDDRETGLRTFLAAFAARQPVEMEYRLRRADGEFRLIATHGQPFIGADGLFGGYIGYAADVTERRLTEARTREQAALLDVAQEAIIVATPDRIVTYWNRAAERLYDIRAADACGQRVERLVGEKETPDYFQAWADTGKNGVWTGERKHFSRSRQPIDVRIQATWVRGSRTGGDAVFIVVSDITESKKLEAQFLRAQRLECLGALASGVAHDLNNVLSPILISIELLRPLARKPEDLELLQMLNNSARRGADIVRQLLLFGRGSDSPRSPLNPGDVVREVAKVMQGTFPKNLSISLQIAADLWQVSADRTQLHQVVLNLCVNARDAMPHGGRLVVGVTNVEVDEPQARRKGGTAAGRYVAIRVTDSGCGISTENLAKIFDPFFTTKPIGEGTGLGLPTVLGIVRSHGGFLDVASEPGQGATFEVYLPAVPLPGAESAAPENQATAMGRGECVLVVDDEESIRNAMQRVLTGMNYRVLTASDGAEALGVFAQNAAAVKLIFTDVMMPVMDGLQMMSVLRRLRPRLPVVAVSGLAAHQAEFQKKFGPQVRFLAKPFSSDLALRYVRESLDEAGE